MKRLGLITALVFSTSIFIAYGQNQKPASPTTAPDQNRAILAAGKRIFVERCASCHNEAGDKPLPSGPPLDQRKLSMDQISRAVAGRLKTLPDDQRRAVTLYISSFLKRN